MKNFTEKIKRIANKTLDILFPNDFKCILCGKDLFSNEYVFCKECLLDDIFNEGNRCVKCDTIIKEGNIICDHCKNSKRFFEKCVCPLNYNDKVKNAILKFKEDNARFLARPFAELIINRLKEENIQFDIIVPVPSHIKTIKRRGYNPSLLLANEIGRILNKPVMEVLVKNVITSKQKFLNYEDRQNNLLDSMTLVDKTSIRGKTILLVDDVITTCATINTCSSLLVKAKKIYACGVARTNINI